MSEVRQRSINEQSEKDDTTSKKKEEEVAEPDVSAPAAVPQGTDNSGVILDTALKDINPRWRNWIIRGIFTWVMLFGFAFIIYLGPLALVLLVLAIQIKCFHEIINIGYVVYKSYELPLFRTLSWYYLITSNYFFYGESLVNYFGVLLSRTEFLAPFITYHRFISFSLYVAGFVAFVFSLVKTHYLKQFTLFGWTHVTLLIVVAQSHLIMQNIFEGLIWLLVPTTMIIANDIFAYLFGFFFGKTPLIKLSPKKTWEGFIGGALSTIIWGIFLSSILARFDYFVCPISYDEVKESLSMECERNPVFILEEYHFPQTLQTFFGMIKLPLKTIHTYPFTLHSISMSIFASVIGPFGGFFASGFKRAFKIKDFGDLIPGHGGIMDRFDCQFLMATFIHVYYSSFIRIPHPQRIIQSILILKPEEQLKVFKVLKDTLIARGLFNATDLS